MHTSSNYTIWGSAVHIGRYYISQLLWITPTFYMDVTTYVCYSIVVDSHRKTYRPMKVFACSSCHKYAAVQNLGFEYTTSNRACVRPTWWKCIRFRYQLCAHTCNEKLVWQLVALYLIAFSGVICSIFVSPIAETANHRLNWFHLSNCIQKMLTLSEVRIHIKKFFHYRFYQST